ncbi:MAG: hypothetical protein Ct9H300mP19_16520 [Dehalococcoidia bacterium]|nr:MAG: hypothetical protein Ct9H300mP19_16520 [Dehalococcoidia bacterium]
MFYKTLGNTEIKVSEFALGCWPFAGGRVWGVPDDSLSIQKVHAALDRELTFLIRPKVMTMIHIQKKY